MPEAYLKIMKIYMLTPFFHNYSFFIFHMGVTETWLSGHHLPSTIDIDDCSFIRSDRTTGHAGGGVCL